MSKDQQPNIIDLALWKRSEELKKLGQFAPPSPVGSNQEIKVLNEERDQFLLAQKQLTIGAGLQQYGKFFKPAPEKDVPENVVQDKKNRGPGPSNSSTR